MPTEAPFTLGAPDTVRVPDTLIVRGTLRAPDTLAVPDTLIVQLKVGALDTLAVLDALIGPNTLRVPDTLAALDTLIGPGTLRVPDTLAVLDTLIGPGTPGAPDARGAPGTPGAPETLVFEPELAKEVDAVAPDRVRSLSRGHDVRHTVRKRGAKEMKMRVGAPLVVNRASVVRPQGEPLSYACPTCDVILYDGIDYLWCPMCSSPVDWVDLSRPFWCCDSCDAIVNEEREDWPDCAACERPMSRVHALESPPPPRSPSATAERAEAIGVTVVTVLQLVQLAALALHPLGLVIVAPFLLLFVFGAVGFLIAALGSLRELCALVRDQRTRSIHGLEHACLNLLERRGCEPIGGQAHDGFFEIEIVNDGRASVEAVQQAADEAMTRVAGGESSLALDPRCGTSLLVGLAVVSALILGATVVGFVEGVHPGILAAVTTIAALLAWWGSRPLGLLAQRTLTVSTRFTAAQVQRIVRVISASGSTATFLVYVHVQLTTTNASAGIAGRGTAG